VTKTITDTLRLIGGGSFLDDAETRLANVVQAVNETGRNGKIELIINVKKTTRGGAMLISGKVKSTLPAGDPMEVMLFATDHGQLTPDNPVQQCLDLRVVDNQTGEIIDTETEKQRENFGLHYENKD